MLAAVQQDWHAFEYAGEEARSNLDLVAAVTKQDDRALKFAHRDAVLPALRKSTPATKLSRR